MSRSPPHVVIVGAGFGGLFAARGLKHAPARVTVVDSRNHHLFQPLLYQVATAALSPADIAAPIRHILARHRNTEVMLATVVAIDTAGRSVTVADGRRISYDYLVLASGAVDHYFGNDRWATAAPGLKSIEDATEIRRRFLLAFEAAEHEEDEAVREALMTFVVVGGGPTGVEMAGAFAEIARRTLEGDFRNIDPTRARVLLIEGGSRLLPSYPDDLSRTAQKTLEKIGVEVRLDSLVTMIEANSVHIGSEIIPARNIVWAAGVSGSPLGRALGAEVDRMGRVHVREDLSVEGHPEVFVVGDLAHFASNEGGPLPGVAPVAMQQGRAVARNILRALRGEPPERFRYRDKGTMATIGRAAAVAQVGRLKLSGFIAWMAWLFIHILYLSGFRNRVVVLLDWAWAYLSWQRGARLITGDVGPRLAREGAVLGAPAREADPGDHRSPPTGK